MAVGWDEIVPLGVPQSAARNCIKLPVQGGANWRLQNAPSGFVT